MGLKNYILKRVILAVFVIFSVMTLTFIVVKSLPQDEIGAMLGEHYFFADKEIIDKLKKVWGLDQPIHVQFFVYMGNFLRGNFGWSSMYDRPVAEELAYRIPATIELVLAGFIMSLCIAIPIGVLSAVKRGTIVDQFSRILAVTGISAPSFWWGLFFLLIFYLFLGFSGTGRLDVYLKRPPLITGFYTIDSLLIGRFDIFLNSLKHIVLPSFTIGLTTSGVLLRITRSSMLEVINSDYIRTARMKGLSERVVIYKHVLRNALIPTVTYAGLRLGGMLGGSVFIETIFNWGGMGVFAVDAIMQSDTWCLMAIVFIMAIMYSLSNLIVDIFYGIIDPRVSVGE